MENNHYKTLSTKGNVLFYSWCGRSGKPNNSEELKMYGKHIATYYPSTNEWYKTKISRPETFEKIR